MARHEISSNEMLMLGVGVLIVGIVLASYSFSTYSEMKQLENQFDFDTLDKNTQISSSDKYLSIFSLPTSAEDHKVNSLSPCSPIT